ncbi:hypothetical protein NEIELOOT_02115 [Neisseria elongata subsp. glycolytica ATCC 29315]|uniref:Uncharacterized protein n=1 Tax=Neisseria elongata subsp. glycolytica ATCC 29315 TaxID=546263 RepID=D4DSS0_NEIEG|nr:hypothetical protein NEIELOOT_02115 [Neisseria elongata subsp. glycolytica ATCC 29315]
MLHTIARTEPEFRFSFRFEYHPIILMADEQNQSKTTSYSIKRFK